MFRGGLWQCIMLQNVSCYKMYHVTKCIMLQNVSCYKMYHVTKCIMLQNVSWYHPDGQILERNHIIIISHTIKGKIYKKTTLQYDTK